MTHIDKEKKFDELTEKEKSMLILDEYMDMLSRLVARNSGN